VPCGCTANQSGGLLRRGTMLAKLRDAGHDVIYADVGGAPAGDSPYNRVKFEAILAGERLMNVAAHNLGRGELAFGPEALREIASHGQTPFVSANARAAADGKPIADGLRIVTVDGKRVAIVGVISPQFATTEFVIDDPRQSIAAVMSAHKGEYDALIVLAYLPEDELTKLAAALPEADAVIGGPTGQAIVPHAAGPVLLGSATNKGKFLVELNTPAASDGRGWTGQIREASADIADDPPQVDNLHAYLAVLEQRDFTAAESGLVAAMPAALPANYRIAGSSSCLSCHAAEAASWQASGHAHAWQTLVGKHFHVDSYCQQCHTTGYGLPGGFESRAKSASLVGVGCESCHGPSAAHVADPHVHTTFDALDQCVRCHDHENSPNFDRAAYWARIRHGKSSATTTAVTRLFSLPRSDTSRERPHPYPPPEYRERGPEEQPQ
jgi:hypothetical protein